MFGELPPLPLLITPPADCGDVNERAHTCVRLLGVSIRLASGGKHEWRFEETEIGDERDKERREGGRKKRGIDRAQR